MILIVIFSYNRAMQLDLLLRSVVVRFKSPEYKIAVIYHTTGLHAEGYNKIRRKYSELSNISFIERKCQILNIKSYFKTFNSLKNIRLYLSHSYLRNKNSDNFKYLLEKLLKTTDCEFTMFNTDDGVFFDDVQIPENILDLIRSEPLQTSYRLYVGENLDGFPKYIQHENNDFYTWNYYENNQITHWTYPFAVDATVYHTKSILGTIQKVAYHNPITLEAYGVEYIKEKKLFKTGLGPFTSKLVGTILNRVSTNSSNPTINLSIEILNRKFLDDYELEIEIPLEIINVNIVPENVFLTKGRQKHLIYSLDQHGKDMQDALGPSGALKQI